MIVRGAFFAMLLFVSSVGVAHAQVFVESRPTWSLTLIASQDVDGEPGGQTRLIKVRLSSKDFLEMMRDQFEIPSNLRLRVTLVRQLGELGNREILDDDVLLHVGEETDGPHTFGEIQESNVLGTVLAQNFDGEEISSEKFLDIGGAGFTAGGLSDNLSMSVVTLTTSTTRFRSLADGEIQGFFVTGRIAELHGTLALEMPAGESTEEFEGIVTGELATGSEFLSDFVPEPEPL